MILGITCVGLSMTSPNEHQLAFNAIHRSFRPAPRRCLAWALVSLSMLAGCGDKPADYFTGYAEGDYVRLAAPITGTLTELHVTRGGQAGRGAPAFVLERESERAARDEAAFRVAQAKSQIADLRKGRRPDEVAAVRAQLAQAEAALTLSSANLLRQQQLVAKRFVSAAALDEARTAEERDRGHVKELRSQLNVVQLAARSDEIAAAEQEMKAAEAQLAQATWRVDQKTVSIPADARVVDVLYRVGELVPAGSPVVSLLPPPNIKARFFVPEATLGKLALGQAVNLRCDGCGAPIAAKISLIAREAEYTSPLIYSKENRATLVFMVEALPAPADAVRLHPGQPLEIRLSGPAQ
jgi:HlyD family secretion protein